MTTSGSQVPTRSGDGGDLSWEYALCTAMFMKGSGALMANDFPLWTVKKYVVYRFRQAFSISTMFVPYVLLWGVVRNMNAAINALREVNLEKDLQNFRRQRMRGGGETPTYEEENELLLRRIPGNIVGSPSYHRQHMQDVACMVEKWGMPTHFLTLTADETTRTRWQEVNDLEAVLHDIDGSLTYKNAPCEAALIYLHRVTSFLKKYVLCKPGIYGDVLHYVHRIESQGRGSLHSHIMLWLTPEDAAIVDTEICACYPLDENMFAPPTASFPHKFKPSDDANVTALAQYVLAKQHHECHVDKCRPHNSPYCKDHYPMQVQPSTTPVWRNAQKKYLYYRPRECDAYVDVYHPATLLIWGARINMQKVTGAAWSAYLLK
jgi:hypothetical protein